MPRRDYQRAVQPAVHTAARCGPQSSDCELVPARSPSRPGPPRAALKLVYIPGGTGRTRTSLPGDWNCTAGRASAADNPTDAHPRPLRGRVKFYCDPRNGANFLPVMISILFKLFFFLPQAFPLLLPQWPRRAIVMKVGRTPCPLRAVSGAPREANDDIGGRTPNALRRWRNAMCRHM